MSTIPLGEFSLDRMVRAVERVRERLLRSTSALERAGIHYAVVGGNAVGAWVAKVDEAAVRNTRDVNILLRREDLPVAKAALEAAGFVYRHAASLDMFLDGPEAKARDAVHIVFARERFHADDVVAHPDVTESEPADSYRVLSLQALVQIKLTAYRRKDQVHLEDLRDVGLIDETWPGRFVPELAARLRAILDTPGR